MRRKVWLAWLIAGSAAGILGMKSPEPVASAEQWADSIIQELTLEQQIGQLYMVAAYSNRGPEHEKEILSLIRKHHIGGLIFFQGGPGRQARLTNRYQQASKVPLLIGMDAEWGLGMRLDSTLSFPKQMTLGAIRSDHLIYDMGQEIARQFKLLGMHVNFAPVVDVNVNPDNPVIGYRSFGEHRMDVARKGIIYMKGLQDHGVMANAKHFPGHGDTNRDSHLTLPVVQQSKSRLDSIELFPFRALIQEGLQSAMVAHLHVPAYDDRSRRPTTLSGPVIDDLLKGQLGFDGLVFTDALNMRGVTQFYDPGEVDLEALQAGNDVLLYPLDVEKGVRRIRQAVAEGTLTPAFIEARAKKILMAKYRLGLNRPAYVEEENLYSLLNPSYAKWLKQRLFEEAVTVVKNEGMLPLKELNGKRFASLSMGAEELTPFQLYLEKYASFSHFNLPKRSRPDPQALTDLVDRLAAHDVVVVGLHQLNNSPSRNFGASNDDYLLLRALAARTQVIVVAFGNAYSLRYFDNFPHLVMAYENDPLMQKVVPQVIFGALPARGMLPVSASDKAPYGSGVALEPLGRLAYSFPEQVGMRPDSLAIIDSIVQEAIASKATPGCQVLVARNGSVVYNKSFGHLSYDRAQPVTDSTLYDVASVTKVAATLQTVMHLADQDRIDLDKKATVYLPELRKTNKKNMVIKDILTHQAGLQAWIPFWMRTMEEGAWSDRFYSSTYSAAYATPVAPGLYGITSLPDSLWQWVLDSKLRRKPRRRPYDYTYSDLGFFMMKSLAERVREQPMTTYLEDSLYQPLGMNQTGYLPYRYVNINRIAPTENDTLFRMQLLRGYVHDPGAAMLGGVGGHAGLFSNANDLAILMQMHLQGGVYGGRRYYKPETVALFTRRYFDTNRRGLGWDKPETDPDKGTPAAPETSPAAFGHLGFTGTSVWADPSYNLVYVFLSNRVHPDAYNRKLIDENVRTRIQSAIYHSMIDYDPSFDSHPPQP